jgi:uncharacterized protein (TIGR03118 family)
MRKHLEMTAAAGDAAPIGGAVGVGITDDGDGDGDADSEDHSGAARQGSYTVTNLVSNVEGLAKVTDPNVVNPWGVAFAPGAPLWVVENGSHALTLYTLNPRNDMPEIVNLVVKLGPQDSPDTWAPTGLVWNPRPDQFHVPGTRSGATFIAVSEDGKIVAWSGSANPISGGLSLATVVRTDAGGVYKAAAFGTNPDGNFIFVTNFRAARVEVYDVNFKEVHKFAFADRDIPSGFAPFGIENIAGELFVTYAQQDADKGDDVPGPGLGFVDVFTTSGKLVRRFASRGPLDAPWGLARAPLGFGKFGGAILVGNFGDGRINAFSNRGEFLGPLSGRNGQPIKIEGLWSLKFGMFEGADPVDLYFTAGINDEEDGLIGEISARSGRH